MELGARLFRHLLALPIAYFQARRVGDSVARVRELENIRQFLTSSALTLVIDLFFTFVFIAVMFYYSPLVDLHRTRRLSHFTLRFRLRRPAVPSPPRREVPRAAPRTKHSSSKASPALRRSRRWRSSRRCSAAGKQLAGYVAASFRVLSLSNIASQAVQLVNKVVIALYCTLAQNWLSTAASLSANSLPSTCWPRASAARCCAWRKCGRISIRPASRWHGSATSSTRCRSRTSVQGAPHSRRSAAQITFEHVTFRYRVDGTEVLHDVSFSVSPGQIVASSVPQALARARLPSWFSGFTCRRAGASWSMASISPWSISPGCAARSASCCRKTCCSTVRCAKTSPLPIRRSPMERVIAAAKLAGAHEFILELQRGL